MYVESRHPRLTSFYARYIHILIPRMLHKEYGKSTSKWSIQRLTHKLAPVILLGKLYFIKSKQNNLNLSTSLISSNHKMFNFHQTLDFLCVNKIDNASLFSRSNDKKSPPALAFHKNLRGGGSESPTTLWHFVFSHVFTFTLCKYRYADEAPSQLYLS